MSEIKKASEIIFELIGKSSRYKNAPMVYGHQFDQFLDGLTQVSEFLSKANSSNARLIEVLEKAKGELEEYNERTQFYGLHDELIAEIDDVLGEVKG